MTCPAGLSIRFVSSWSPNGYRLTWQSAGPLSPQDRCDARRAGAEAHPVLSRVLQLCLCQVRSADHRDVFIRERSPDEHRCRSRRDGGQAVQEVGLYEEGSARGHGDCIERRGQLPRKNPWGHQVRDVLLERNYERLIADFHRTIHMPV